MSTENQALVAEDKPPGIVGLHYYPDKKLKFIYIGDSKLANDALTYLLARDNWGFRTGFQILALANYLDRVGEAITSNGYDERAYYFRGGFEEFMWTAALRGESLAKFQTDKTLFGVLYIPENIDNLLRNNSDLFYDPCPGMFGACCTMLDGMRALYKREHLRKVVDEWINGYEHKIPIAASNGEESPGLIIYTEWLKARTTFIAEITDIRELQKEKYYSYMNSMRQVANTFKQVIEGQHLPIDDRCETCVEAKREIFRYVKRKDSDDLSSYECHDSNNDEDNDDDNSTPSKRLRS